MNTGPRVLLAWVGLLCWVGLGSDVAGKPIGGERQPHSCCECSESDDAPGGSGACPAHGNCVSGGCTIEIEKSSLSQSHRLFRAQAENGVGLNYSLHYASYNADGEKAVVRTVLGYGWSHTYNVFLFRQGNDLFKMSPGGLTTKYQRAGRSGPLTATRGHQQTIVEIGGGVVEIRNNDGLTYRYEPIPGNPLRVAGTAPLMLTKITDRNGNMTTLTYVGGLLDRVRDEYGHELRFQYDAIRRLIKTIDPKNRETRYAYDGAGHLARVTDPLGQVTKYQYDVSHHLTRKTDRNGRIWTYQYDASGNPVRVIDPAGNPVLSMGNSSNWATDPNALTLQKQRVYIPSITTVTDGRGNAWQYHYDQNGSITQVIAPDGATTTYTYDPATLNKASQTDDNDHTTTYEYDPRGNLLEETNHLGHTTTYTYEPVFNMMTSMTDANGRVTIYEYDASGNRIRETDPLGGVREWTYDTRGNVLTETDENGHVAMYEYDAFGRRNKITDAEGNVTQMTYDIIGNLLSRTDDNNHITTYQYDALDRLIKETDALSQMTTMIYDPEGNRIQTTDRNGNITRYEYDARDRLVKTTDALTFMETMSYDNNDNRITMTDKNGHITLMEYDVQNRLRKTTDAEGNMTTRSYDGVGNVLSETDANGHTTTFAYDDLNRRIRITDAENHVTQMFYDMVGLAGCPECTGPTRGSSRVTQQTDGNGKVTYYKYDGLDRLIREIRKEGDVADVQDASDAVTRYTYDAADNRLTVTEPNTNTMTWDYDDVNRVIKLTNAAGDMTLTDYDGVSNVTKTTAPNGNEVQYFYDALDRLIRIEDSIGLVATYTYDAEGHRATECDGNGHCTTNAYDAIYRVIKVTDALGEFTQNEYDPVGNLIKVTDREGNATTYTYDDINRRLTATDAQPATTTSEYDGVGNLIRLTDANGHATQYDYDDINRLIKETYADPTPNMRTFEYDAVNLIKRTDQQGQMTQYVYNDLYFLVERDYPLSGDDSMSYDASGRMLSACREGALDDLPLDACAGWLVEYQYDGANRVIQTTQNGQVIDYVYDIPGRKRTLTYPGGREVVEMTDARGRLDTIDDPDSPPPIVLYSYDLGNRVLSREYRNGTGASYGYNDNDWILTLEHTDGLNTIAGFGHEFDKEGNKRFGRKDHDVGRSEAYQYDNIYRLIDYKVGTLVGSTVPVPVTQTQYDLDPVGNWDVKTQDLVPEIRMHNEANEITQIDAEDIFHDDNGNLEEDDRHTYAYDEENRLTGVTRNSDNKLVGEYQYDALSRRVAKIADPDLGPSMPLETRYLYDAARIIEEQDAVTTTLATYVYGASIDEVLSMDRDGGSFFYHQNALGSVEASTDAAANVVERYTYDAYGLPMTTDGSGVPVADNPWGTPHSDIGNPWMFTGRHFDEETGLYHYRARQYDPIKGRFLQRDPVGYVDGVNLYEYANSNPLNGTDPTGTFYQSSLLGGSGTRHPRAYDGGGWNDGSYLWYYGYYQFTNLSTQVADPTSHVTIGTFGSYRMHIDTFPDTDYRGNVDSGPVWRITHRCENNRKICTGELLDPRRVYRLERQEGLGISGNYRLEDVRTNVQLTEECEWRAHAQISFSYTGTSQSGWSLTGQVGGTLGGDGRPGANASVGGTVSGGVTANWISTINVPTWTSDIERFSGPRRP